MKFLSALCYLTVVAAGCGSIDSLCTTRTTRMYTQPTRSFRTYTQATRRFRTYNQPARIIRNFVKYAEPTRIIRKYIQPTRVVRSWTAPVVKRIVRQPIVKRTLILPTKKVFVQKPEIPTKVTRVTRNIHAHIPMVHERVRRNVIIENTKKKNFIHHFIKPVKDINLGQRTGRSSQEETEHIVHKDSSFAQKEEEDTDINSERAMQEPDGLHWEV